MGIEKQHNRDAGRWGVPLVFVIDLVVERTPGSDRIGLVVERCRQIGRRGDGRRFTVRAPHQRRRADFHNIG